MAYTDGEEGIWLVVKPEVGLMWLLGGVALLAVLCACTLNWPHEVVPAPTGKAARLRWRSNTSFRTHSNSFHIVMSPKEEMGLHLLGDCRITPTCRLSTESFWSYDNGGPKQSLSDWFDLG